MTPRKPAGTPNTPKPKDAGKKAERVQKQYAPVSLADLKPREVTKEEKTTVLPGRERSPEQKAVDATVRDLAYKYLRAGSPKVFRDMPVVAYTLPTAQAETVRFMLQKACNLLNCKPKFGRAAWDNGDEVVTFCPLPRDPSQWVDEPEKEEDKAPEAIENDKAPEAKTPEAKAPEAKRTDPSEFAGDDA